MLSVEYVVLGTAGFVTKALGEVLGSREISTGRLRSGRLRHEARAKNDRMWWCICTNHHKLDIIRRPWAGNEEKASKRQQRQKGETLGMEKTTEVRW